MAIPGLGGRLAPRVPRWMASYGGNQGGFLCVGHFLFGCPCERTRPSTQHHDRRLQVHLSHLVYQALLMCDIIAKVSDYDAGSLGLGGTSSRLEVQKQGIEPQGWCLLRAVGHSPCPLPGALVLGL